MAGNDKRIELGGSVWMTVGGENLGGQGRMALLSLVGTHGSITHAAKAMGMSYKAAWDAIDTMNNLAGEPLVERLAGGKGGGGTRLTARGSSWCRTSGSSRPSTGASSRRWISRPPTLPTICC